MKKVLAVILLIAACGGGYYWWAKQNPGKQSSEPSRTSLASAEIRNINFAVSAAGEITPAEQVSVRPEINGKIEMLPVDVGDKPKKGDILFKLDDKELQQQRASNATEIDRSKIELQKAERDFNRARDLLGEKLISQELFDNTRTSYDLAKVGLERSQRDLALIEERLTKTIVRAPFDCTVLLRPVSMGQAVSGSGGFNSGTEVLSIADLNSMIINAQVNQADVPRLSVNQPVEVTVEAVPGLLINGVVERISPQATIKNNIKGYPARIVLRNVDPRVRPGMTANVKIPVASAEGVTAVPLAAVFTEKNPDNNEMERFVYVQQGEGFNKRNVKVGVSDYFFAEIQDGLATGEIVSLELPKEEREKKAKQISNEKGGGGKSTLLTGARSNAPALGNAGAAQEDTKAPRPPQGTATAPQTKS